MRKIVGLILLVASILTFTSCKYEPEVCHNTSCSNGWIKCGECRGKGLEVCYSCKGSGACTRCDGYGWYYDNPVCPACNGEGFFMGLYGSLIKCGSCKGVGKLLLVKKDCYNCDGKCYMCKGSGLAENAKTCEKCNGAKKLDCPDCVDGYIE